MLGRTYICIGVAIEQYSA